MGLDFLLPKLHFFAFAGFGLPGLARTVAVGTALSHPPLKSRGRVMNMPPVALLPDVAAVVGHGLQIKAGAQALGRDGLGDNAAVTAVKDAVTGYIGRLVPKTAQAFEKAEKVVQMLVLNFSSTIIYDNVVRGT
jgi:hypothetical protein